MFALTDDFLSSACSQALIDLPTRPTEDELCQAMDRVFTIADETWTARRRSLDYLRTAPAPACAAGCGWCCHQTVGVSVAEAIRIALALRGREPDLSAAVMDLNRKTMGMSPAQRVAARTACAFLGVDGNCRIYDVRPLRCRGLYSIDAKFCESSCRDPDDMRKRLERGELQPVYLSVPQALYDSALSGVLLAIRQRRWALVSLELSAAVAALVAEPSLVGRWLRGGKPASHLALRQG